MSYLRLFATAALVSSSIAIGCRPPDVQPDPNATHPLRASAEVYTLVNLHPDDDGELSSVNYLDDDELLPLCTPIRVTFLNTETLNFTVLATGKDYTFEFHDTMKETPGENVAKFFGTECDASVVASLGEVDQQGIREGKVLEGMTKQGVLLAVGYPPEHRTPSLGEDTWRYWESKFDTVEVIFENGVVVKIDD
jgi:hypothetical protein